VTRDELLAHYRSFTHEAIRLETLQHYQVPGDEHRQQAFRQGLPLPTRPDKQTTVDLIHDSVAAGKTIGRIHIVDLPLSNYVQYELAAYRENVDAGEQVWIADRGANPGLDELRHDFAIFDPGTDHAAAIWFDYDPDGLLITHRPATPDELPDLVRQLSLARTHAVPLDSFTTTCEQAR
jgi:hypothetical protein